MSSRMSTSHPIESSSFVVVLVGLSGTGKSTIGRRVAKKLDFTFVDLDSVIESTAGCTVRELFASRGESSFRDLESETLESQLVRGGQVLIAAGGGVVLRESNRRILAKTDFVVWMTASIEELERRLTPKLDSTRNHRPLLDGNVADGLRELENNRRQLYEQVSSATFSTEGKSTDTAVRELTTLIRDRIESTSLASKSTNGIS